MKKHVVTLSALALLSIDAFALKAVVQDSEGKKLRGAAVSFARNAAKTTTDENGAFDLVPSSIKSGNSIKQSSSFAVTNNKLHFDVVSSGPVSVNLYNLRGQNILNHTALFNSGRQSMELPAISSGIYCMQLSLDGHTYTQKVALGLHSSSATQEVLAPATAKQGNSRSQNVADIDTVLFSLSGYTPYYAPISSYDQNLGTIILKSATTQPFTLQLLHFADVDGNENTALGAVDEFSALVQAFKSDKTYGKNSLFVSSGDHIIPGARFYAAEHISTVTGSSRMGSADIALMNAMGVQAAAVGNHELDAGPSVFKDAINYKDAKALFPHLAANVDFTPESFTTGKDGDEASTMAGKTAKYTVVTVNGEKIGLVGASTPTLPTITSAGKLIITPAMPATPEAIAATIQPSVDALKAAGVNKIILLAHMQQIAVEKGIALNLSGVDIIVAGGSNTRMGDATDKLFPGDPKFDETYPFKTVGKDGKPVLIVNVDGDYKYLGRLVVGFDGNGDIDLTSLTADLSGSYASTEAAVVAVGGTPTPKVVEIRDALSKVITAQYQNIVGYTDVFLEGRRAKVRTEETNLGNLSADANLWYARKLFPAGVDISLKNGGGIRTEIGVVTVPPGSTNEQEILFSAPEGKGISEGHLRQTFKFDNGLVVLNVTAAELKDLLEHGVSEVGAGKTPGSFPQIGGMKITYDPTKPARTATSAGERIRELEIIDEKGAVVEDIVTEGSINTVVKNSYRMVTLNYLANGGDLYPFKSVTTPDRHNLYEGLGAGETADFPDATLTNDPGKNVLFSKTGGEQDALAEYLQANHNTIKSAFTAAETPVASDTRIKKK